MDEADKLMSDKLQSQVQAVFNKLPKTIQCIAFSATFTEELVADLSMFMKSPQQIRLTEGVPTLKGTETIDNK
ncbi:hypothetical protein G6F68_018124 [Rhizopus microsporus]|nr:hypothetical protein G6F68_018124 [Rhizopus microsporus]